MPRTQFSVEVLNSLKGDLGGTVTVSHLVQEFEGARRSQIAFEPAADP